MIAARVLVVVMLAAVGIDLAALGLDPAALGPLDLAVLVVTAGVVWLLIWLRRRQKKAAPKPPAEK